MAARDRGKIYWVHILVVGIAAILFWYSLPDPVFSDPVSTAVFDRNGELLGARIADDGQWRFPPSDSLPKKYVRSVLLFEDEYFYLHPGFNPASLFRALFQNLKAGEVVSGGSTISMQVIRLSRKGRSRTLKEKLVEIFLAVRMEMEYSKEEILKMYAANAPFGGNVVGLEAASRRYFGRDPFSLSWSECATLAVLPNSPALIHPGKNRNNLLEKRNRLLTKIFDKQEIDSLSYQMSLLEELPDKPSPLPGYSYHLTDHFYILQKGKRIDTRLDADLQKRLFQVMEIQKERLYPNQIRNAACMIVDVETSDVLAYYGNIRNEDHPEYGGDVDVVHSPRSSGSILKPVLFTEMLYRGEILPGTLIDDIPTRFRGYSPKNYNRSYDGVVPASEALSRSLNVPAVRMLYQYGNERFHHDLRSLGFSTIVYPASHYGLSLILGGAEVCLWDLAGVYSSMARTLNHYTESNGLYFRSDWRMPALDRQDSHKATSPDKNEEGEEQGILGAGAIWLCMEALKEVRRPDAENGWQYFNSGRQFAWKTGTSFGFRDGWAVGTTPEYTIAVWTGNADGEGRAGLTGLNAAAPILFEVLNLLPVTSWFQQPYDDLVKTAVCRQSGYKAGKNCTEIDSVWISPAGLNTGACPYHHRVHLSADRKFRVDASCYPFEDILHQNWFILPPAQEWYYRKKHPLYKELPPLMKSCRGQDAIHQMQIIYPEPGSIIYIPYELDGERGKVVFEAAHRDPGKTIFWHVDKEFVGRTKYFHEIALQPAEGLHRLSLVDEDGNRTSLEFEIIDRE